MNLVTLIELSDSLYIAAKKIILKDTRQPRIFLLLDRVRELIRNEQGGANVIRYLLFSMNNKILKEQYAPESF